MRIESFLTLCENFESFGVTKKKIENSKTASIKVPTRADYPSFEVLFSDRNSRNSVTGNVKRSVANLRRFIQMYIIERVAS